MRAGRQLAIFRTVELICEGACGSRCGAIAAKCAAWRWSYVPAVVAEQLFLWIECDCTRVVADGALQPETFFAN